MKKGILFKSVIHKNRAEKVLGEQLLDDFRPIVFLSHKHGETEILEEVLALLELMEANVYLDWKDQNLPSTTNSETATGIKTQIRNSSKFILIASENALKSPWCNWELGFADAIKEKNSIAILPIKETDYGDFAGNEYLQLYPVITTDYETYIGNYNVEYGSNTKGLKEWLNS